MNKRYTERRAELIREMYWNLSIHCRLNARARIRKIADLEYEVKGTDREETKNSLGYYNLK